MTELRARHLLAGVVAALALHGAAAVLIFGGTPQPGAAGAGRGGLELGMGLAGGAPGIATAEPEAPPPVAADAAIGTAIPAPVPPASRVEPVATGARPVAVARVAATVPQAAADRRVAEAAPILSAEAVRAQAPAEPDRRAAAPSLAPTPPTRPARTAAVSVRAARAEPPEDRSDARSREPRDPGTAERRTVAPAVASGADTGGRTTIGEATGRGGNAGSGRTASLGGQPGARLDYIREIAARLAREKRYPRSARLRRQQGTGHLRFTLDASGRVLAQSIARSTGHASLDEEITALLSRAAPLPPIPAEIGRDALEIIVPIRFRLR